MNRLWLSLTLIPSLIFAQDAPPKATPVREAPPSGMVEVNRIAATANGRSITAKEVGIMLGPIIGQLMAEFPRRGPEFERQINEAKDKIMQELIDRELIMSEFKAMEKQGANLPDTVVDQEIERQIREVYNGSTQYFRDELSKAGMTKATYREMTREKLIVQAMRQEKFKDAAPPLPDEVRKEYSLSKDSLRDTSKDSITYRKIFLPLLDPSNPLATPETQLALADTLAEELKAGADFAELALQHSQDAFASEGGLQSDVPRPDLSPEFAAILFEGKDGQILGPLQDPAGFTIAKIEKIKKGPVPPFSEVKELMDQRVRAKKTSEDYEEWIANLRAKAMVKIMLK